MADEKATNPKSDRAGELPTPKILWKVVEPRHYLRAQERKKESKAAYTDYVLSLVERLDDKLVGLPGQGVGEMPVGAVQLSREQVKQVIDAFEAKFGDKPQ